MSNGEYLSTKQVAQLLFVVDSRVRQLALSGALPAKMSEAMRYVEDVLAGRRRECRWVRLACERHVNDLGRGTSAGCGSTSGRRGR
jgi:hypothetical protein